MKIAVTACIIKNIRGIFMTAPRYINPPILKVALLGSEEKEVDKLRSMYDLYGLVRLDTYSNSLFPLNASLGFEPVEPKKANCVLICTENDAVPEKDSLQKIIDALKDKPCTLTLVVSLVKNTEQARLPENYARNQKAWSVALGNNIEILHLPLLNLSVSDEEKLAKRHMFLDRLKRQFIYSSFLRDHLNSNDLYDIHRFPPELVNIVCETIGNPAVEEISPESSFRPGACRR